MSGSNERTAGVGVNRVRSNTRLPNGINMQTSFISPQLLKKENIMNRSKHSKIGFAFGTVILVALTGCIVAPRPRAVYLAPPPVYEERVVVVQDDYLYYPGYQVYYSSNRRQYIYQDGRSWVARTAPPRVSVDVLFASPSVRLDFHDAPSIHHAKVVKQYPKHWAPPGGNPNNAPGHQNNGKGNGQGDRR